MRTFSTKGITEDHTSTYGESWWSACVRGSLLRVCADVYCNLLGHTRDFREGIFQFWGREREIALYVTTALHDMTLNTTVEHAPPTLHYTSTFVSSDTTHHNNMH